MIATRRLTRSAPPIYTLRPWDGFKMVGLSKDETKLVWGGTTVRHDRLGRPEAETACGFLNLAIKPENATKQALRLAAAFGPLGLCERHRLPLGHVPRHALDQLRHDLEDESDWHLGPCTPGLRGQGHSTRLPGSSTRAQVAETIEEWLNWSKVLHAITAVAWRVQNAEVADYEDVAPLDPFVPVSVDDLPWRREWDRTGKLAFYRGEDRRHPDVPILNIDENTRPGSVLVRHPDTNEYVRVPLAWGDRPSALRRGRAFAASLMIDEQRLILEASVERLSAYVGLGAHLDWDKGQASLTYGGGTFLGALVAQLVLRLGGHNALAVCDLCRTTWDPGDTWPRSGPGEGTYCPGHSNPTDRRRHRRRVGAAR